MKRLNEDRTLVTRGGNRENHAWRIIYERKKEITAPPLCNDLETIDSEHHCKIRIVKESRVTETLDIYVPTIHTLMFSSPRG